MDEDTLQIKSTLTIWMKPSGVVMYAICILHDCLYTILHVTKPVGTYIVQMHNSIRTTFRTCISFASLVIIKRQETMFFVCNTSKNSCRIWMARRSDKYGGPQGSWQFFLVLGKNHGNSTAEVKRTADVEVTELIKTKSETKCRM